MSLIDDLRAVSENAVEQLAARFSDLPRPLLVAIGAGDMAVARFADLRESLAESLGDRVGPPSVDLPDVRAAVADLPSKAQRVAGVAADLPSKAQRVAADLPSKAQQVAADLPSRAQKAATDLPAMAQKVAADVAASIENFAAEAPGQGAGAHRAAAGQARRDPDRNPVALARSRCAGTMDAYGQLAALIYGNLADRGSPGLDEGAFARACDSGPGPSSSPAPPGAGTTAAARRLAPRPAARASAAAVRAGDRSKAGPDAEVRAEPPVPKRSRAPNRTVPSRSKACPCLRTPRPQAAGCRRSRCRRVPADPHRRPQRRRPSAPAARTSRAPVRARAGRRPDGEAAAGSGSRPSSSPRVRTSLPPTSSAKGAVVEAHRPGRVRSGQAR